jgi:transcriptional regulator with XRE-family HTH domain
MWYIEAVMNSNQATQSIARRVKEARLAAGLSQEELGKKVGLTKVGYGEYERGRRLFDTEQLFHLSRILGRPVEYFLGLDTGLSEEEGQLLASYRAIDSEQGRRIALGVVRDSAVEYRTKPD